MPMRCLNCGDLVVAPVVSNFVSSDDVEHVWYCSDCFAVFDNVSSFCAGEERRLYYGSTSMAATGGVNTSMNIWRRLRKIERHLCGINID